MDREGGKPAPTPAADQGKPAGPPPVKRRRKWLHRLAAVILAPVLILALLEIGLRLGGFGDSTDFFLDGTDLERPDVWIDNAAFGKWAFPRRYEHIPQPVQFVLPRTKAEGTYRVFVVGESAAMGFPDPTMSFARVLEVMLRATMPNRRVELVNAAMAAINSHIALPIVRECLRQQPDLLVVHLGNNEVVGPFGGAGVLGPVAPGLRLIRANLALRTTRTGQLFDRLSNRLAASDDSQQVWQGMEMFVHSQVRSSDERLSRIYGHFRRNLEDIADACTAARVPVIFCTIPVNLADSAPFGSLHDPGLDANRLALWEKLYQAGIRLEGEKNYADAIRSYEAAERIDSGFAELAFRLGRCYAALGNMDKAQPHFVRAWELDTLRFRADAAIIETIRSVATEQAAQGVRLADAERTFADASPGKLPGEDLFFEHVHMTFHGNYLLARTVFETLVSGDDSLLTTHHSPLTEEECADRLAYSEWNEWKFGTSISEQFLHEKPFTMQLDWQERAERWKTKLAAIRSRLNAGGIDKAVAQHEKAVQAAESDWMIRMNFAQLLSERGDWPGAYAQYQRALSLIRHNFTAQYMVGMLDLTNGQPHTAEAHFRDALRISPNYLEAHIGLAESLERQGKNDEALAVFNRPEVRNHPHRALTSAALGRFFYRRGNLDKAKAHLRDALYGEPNNPGFHADLGEIAAKQSNIDEAIKYYEAALRIQPDWPELTKLLTELRKKRGQSQK